MPRLLLTITALLTVLAIGCGGDSSSSSSAPASLVPAGAPVYAEANLHPSGEQQAAINSIIEKFPGQGSAGERIRGLLEKALSESDTGLSYSKDIEPWLGDQAGFFVSSLGNDGGHMSGAAVVATDDEDAAQAAVDKAKGGRDASYKGHDYRTFDDDAAAGVVDGWVVIGTEGAFKAAVDTAEGGSSLDDDEKFQDAIGDAADDRLGFVYVDTPSLAKRLQGAGAPVGPFADIFKDPVVATVNATAQGVRIESKLPKSFSAAIPFFGEGGDLAGDLPADSWLALSVPNLGETLSGVFSAFSANGAGIGALSKQLEAATGIDIQRDVLSWMGDASIFVRGTSVDRLNGALVIETKDEAASGRFIDTVAGLVRNAGQVTRSPGGYTLRTSGLPQPIHLFQRDGKVVLAYGDAAAHDALDPGRRLADSQAYKDAQDALGGGYDLAFFLSFPQIVQLVDSTGAGDDETWLKIKPYLEPLGAVAAGGKKEGDEVRSALGVSVR